MSKEKNSVSIGGLEVSSLGKFRLDVNRDPVKFAATNISAFVPFGKGADDVLMFKTEAGDTPTLFIDKISIVLDPSNSVLDDHNVRVLIQHPDVRVSGMTEQEHRELVKKNLKFGNPKFTITNVDKVKDQNFEKEKAEVVARGKLYAGTLGIEKMRWLCSNFGISYRTEITDKAKYDQHLTKLLDKFICSGESQRLTFLEAIENIKKTEYIFYINELKNLGIITDIGGIYKVGDKPVGATNDHIVAFYEENAEIFNLHKQEVAKALAKYNF